MSELLKIDKEYANWIEGISRNFKRLQIKAAFSVNVEMLRFYWIIGKGISENLKKSKYGDNFYNNLSNDLNDRIPNVKGFSVRNLHYMYQFYQLFTDSQILPQVGAELVDNEILPQAGAKLDKVSNDVQNIEKSAFFAIPWGHIKIIIDKCNDNIDKALYYAKQTIENN